MNDRRGDYITTASGVRFWPLDPRPEEVGINDIAHALANVCRWNGHAAKHYSTAEHCVRVAHLLKVQGYGRSVQLAGLLHDASDAYLPDVPRPIKRLPEFAAFRLIEQGVEAVIASAFNALYPWPSEVHEADRLMLIAEGRDLMRLSDGDRLVEMLDDANEIPKILPWIGSGGRAYLSKFRELY